MLLGLFDVFEKIRWSKPPRSARLRPASDTMSSQVMWWAAARVLSLTVVLLRTTMYNSLMVSMTVSEARAALPELLSRVEGGEEITITRHGRPAAVLVRPDALRSRRAEAALEDAGRIHELLTQAAGQPLPEGPGLTAQRAEELVAAIRAGRDTR